MTFKLNHELLGGHVHIAVFSGKDRDHLGKCGDLVMRAEEWPEFVAALLHGPNDLSGLTEEEMNDYGANERSEIIFKNVARRQPDASGASR
jgi:hypothetical protein